MPGLSNNRIGPQGCRQSLELLPVLSDPRPGIGQPSQILQAVAIHRVPIIFVLLCYLLKSASPGLSE